MKSLAGQLQALADHLWNLYGPTETTVWATAHQVTASDLSPAAPAVVCIGKALPGYRVWLDAGEEIVIAGAAVALGYLANPANLQQRFGKATSRIHLTFATTSRKSR